ncbi:MAG: HAD family phosphatase [Mariniblastus sp.]|nr:HAD family phosphatase [Mariniblastus sp.]
MTTTRFVFFDVGNVILNFSHERSCRQVAELIGMDIGQVEELIFQNGLQNQYESGEVSSAGFAAKIRSDSREMPSNEAVVSAASDIFWLNREIVPLITALRMVNFPLGILSNTCAGHWQYVTKTAPLVKLYFTKFILSHESKCMKPNPKIYRDAIESVGLPPESIFFVDDRPENVEMAQRMGMDSHIYRNASQVLRLLDDRGVRLNF